MKKGIGAAYTAVNANGSPASITVVQPPTTPVVIPVKDETGCSCQDQDGTCPCQQVDDRANLVNSYKPDPVNPPVSITPAPVTTKPASLSLPINNKTLLIGGASLLALLLLFRK